MGVFRADKFGDDSGFPFQHGLVGIYFPLGRVGDVYEYAGN